MITAAQFRATHSLLGVEQEILVAMASVSFPAAQRINSSEGAARNAAEAQYHVYPVALFLSRAHQFAGAAA